MSSSSAVSEYYIKLSDEPIRFEPVCKFTSVFFDEANQQVFAVRSGGATGVSVKGPDEKSCFNFRMDDKGGVISIKFSPDLKVLAIQRTERSVEFLNFLSGMDSVEYSQSCKGRNTTILGFNWTSPGEIVFITDHGIEYYQVIAEKRSLKLIKSYSITINWLVYMPHSSILLLSSATLGNVLHPYQFKAGTVHKISKFEVDLPVIPRPPRLSLLERDVSMADIYELLINTLVASERCYQLHQFIQYHVLADSKPLACSLLALHTSYPPAHQLALDMLKRLTTANDDMVEVLLSKNQLLSALRFVRSVGISDNVSSRKFLEAAMGDASDAGADTEGGDPMLFYTVFKFFEQRNVRLRGSPAFRDGEQCQRYVAHFCKLFGKEALMEAGGGGGAGVTAGAPPHTNSSDGAAPAST